MNNQSTLLSNFTQYLTETKNNSPNTIKSYIHDLTKYFEYHNNNQTLSPTSNLTLTRPEILAYKQYLQQTKAINAKTINRILSSLKSYNEFLILTHPELQQSLLILSTDYIKIQKSFTSPTNITLKEAIKFMDKIKSSEPYRNYAIVTLIVNTGLRISEALSIKLSNLYLDDNEMTIIGKGNKQRDIIINSTAIKVINEYLTNHRNNYKYAATSEYLFVSNKGEKLDPTTIQKIFNNHSKKITPHSLRHCFATNALENNILDIRSLQQQLGHSSLETVQVYTHPSKNRMKKNLNMKEACIG